MNEIQALRTETMEKVKKNNKKGFTLVELVVVIAILAVIAAIAIPVVSTIIDSSNRSKGASNAQTIELAIKEAQAQIASNDVSNGYSDTTTIANVADAKAIQSAFDSITVNGVEYKPVWVNTAQKVAFVGTVGTALTSIDGSTTIGGQALATATTTALAANGTAAITTLK